MPKILPYDVPMRAACALRSWWNSWWKCRRSYPIPRYCGLWSTTSTFQFLVVVEDQVLVFKVVPLDSVQQRRLPSKKRISERIVEQIVDPVSSGRLHGSLPGQGSSSSHSPAGVEERADEPGEGVFRTFPQNKKKCEGGFALGVGTAPRVEPIHAGCSAGGLRRVGAAQGWRRWQVLLLEQTHSSDCLEGTSWCRGCLVRYSG